MRYSLSPRAVSNRKKDFREQTNSGSISAYWLIWLKSKADSIVWMGEDGGSADIQKVSLLGCLLSVPLYINSRNYVLWEFYRTGENSLRC